MPKSHSAMSTGTYKYMLYVAKYRGVSTVLYSEGGYENIPRSIQVSYFGCQGFQIQQTQHTPPHIHSTYVLYGTYDNLLPGIYYIWHVIPTVPAMKQHLILGPEYRYLCAVRNTACAYIRNLVCNCTFALCTV